LAKCLIIGLLVFLYNNASIIYLLSSTIRILNLAELSKVDVELDAELTFEFLIIGLTTFFWLMLSSN
jgi:hypothetical protein